MTEERVPPGGFEARHYHAQARQFFYVLKGNAVLEVEGVEHGLGEGTGIEVEPGLPHQFFNRSAADVWFLVVSDSKDNADRIDVGDTFRVT